MKVNPPQGRQPPQPETWTRVPLGPGFSQEVESSPRYRRVGRTPPQLVEGGLFLRAAPGTQTRACSCAEWQGWGRLQRLILRRLEVQRLRNLRLGT